MLLRERPYGAVLGEPPRARAVAARFLRAASRAFHSLAERLAVVDQQPLAEPVFEFHGEAGAPEGALYVDGQLVGHVLGVNRL
jgi:hypothetical protein